MSEHEPAAPQHVPTLTEVVDWPQALPSPTQTAVLPPGLPLSSAGELAETVLTEAQLVQRVLADLQRQTDLMLDYRLREVLTPLLARATDNLIREARGELASTLRDVVARAVAQEMARHRGG